MKHKVIIVTIAFLANYAFATEAVRIDREVEELRRQTIALQAQLTRLENKLEREQKQKKRTETSQVSKPQPVSVRHVQVVKQAPSSKSGVNHTVVTSKTVLIKHLREKPIPYHSSLVSVHSLDKHPEFVEFYPTALIADGHVVSYIAGTPIVSVPYLGERPSFDGSDHIVNISSINRDIRLM